MTDVTLPHFPGDLLREANLLWEIQGTVLSGGQTATGAMPITRLDGGGLWKCTLGQVGLWDADRRRSWRALTAICDGVAQPIVVPVHDMVDQPWPLIGGVPDMTFDIVSHDDGTFFYDGTGYESGLIEINCAGGASLRETGMNVRIVAGDDLKGGEHFSIDHPDLRHRLYRVRTAVDNGGGSWAITFRPPLRADVLDGTQLNFDRPQCVMRLAKPDAMDATF